MTTAGIGATQGMKNKEKAVGVIQSHIHDLKPLIGSGFGITFRLSGEEVRNPVVYRVMSVASRTEQFSLQDLPFFFRSNGDLQVTLAYRTAEDVKE